MRVATIEETFQLCPDKRPKTHPVLCDLIFHYLSNRWHGIGLSDGWHHIRLDEYRGKTLMDQIEALVTDAGELGYTVETKILEGHPESGFFARILH